MDSLFAHSSLQKIRLVSRSPLNSPSYKTYISPSLRPEVFASELDHEDENGKTQGNLRRLVQFLEKKVRAGYQGHDAYGEVIADEVDFWTNEEKILGDLQDDMGVRSKEEVEELWKIWIGGGVFDPIRVVEE